MNQSELLINNTNESIYLYNFNFPNVNEQIQYINNNNNNNITCLISPPSNQSSQSSSSSSLSQLTSNINNSSILGQVIWPGSLLLITFLSANINFILQHQHIIELGTGSGLVGIYLMKLFSSLKLTNTHYQIPQLYLTDKYNEVISLTKTSFDLNSTLPTNSHCDITSNTHIQQFTWGSSFNTLQQQPQQQRNQNQNQNQESSSNHSRHSQDQQHNQHQSTLFIASDIFFSPETALPILLTLSTTPNNTCAVVTFQHRGNHIKQAVISTILEFGYKIDVLWANNINTKSVFSHSTLFADYNDDDDNLVLDHTVSTHNDQLQFNIPSYLEEYTQYISLSIVTNADVEKCTDQHINSSKPIISTSELEIWIIYVPNND